MRFRGISYIISIVCNASGPKLLFRLDDFLIYLGMFLVNTRNFSLLVKTPHPENEEDFKERVVDSKWVSHL